MSDSHGARETVLPSRVRTPAVHTLLVGTGNVRGTATGP
eukprot:CAMPEP_0181230624 /NCGR_PEP_ID=MMETSP1096-20121128/34592_1 /TAXON_ID=156174 ORGANISM="Chrysochromulina ericina, Strain CCMP281" /NCGR_SAMPLE_ID=MMETSP1096 /ASSEMBLY_ACC=CAM_ASM_000453 /LENGTH=38 /DNA_ID= /DNA_START= /DNA_END= /DNA_ORIENTATION=